MSTEHSPAAAATEGTSPGPSAPRCTAQAGPAPRVHRVLAHARFETRVMLSNGEQLLVSLMLPLMVLVGLWMVPIGRIEGVDPIRTALAAAVCAAIIATALTSQSIQTGFDRRNGVLRWIASTPLGRDGYLAGKIIATLLIHALQLIVLGIAATVLGWRPDSPAVLGVLPVGLLGAIAFGAIGLLIAGTLRTEGVLAASNGLLVLLIAAGGVITPVSSVPRFLAGLLDLLPSGALAELMRACLAEGRFSIGSVVVLLGWAAAMVAAVVRWFRWTSS